ncbi:MAG: glycosyltransferase [Novosphingobium sp.]
MKILTFIHSFHPGGVERVALRLVRDWRARGIVAPLFVGRAEGVMLGDVGKDMDFASPRQPRWGSAWWETFWMIYTLPRAIRAERPDVLFCAGNSLTVVAFFTKVRLGRRCPPILVKISNELQWRHKSAWARFWYRIWLWLQARTFTGVVAMEQAMVPEIVRYLYVQPEQVSVIPDPALTGELLDALGSTSRPAWWKGQPRRFVAVGRLVRQKNLPLMLDAFACGAGPHDTLDLIGEGAERAALEAQAQALGLGERVRFVGYRPEPALDLGRYDALLLSSDFEGVPAVLLEALAAGIDIVATDCSASVASLLGHGRFGALVPVRDCDALAAAIAALEPGTQDRAGSFAQVRAFTTQAAGPAYARVAARIAGKPANMHDVDRADGVVDAILHATGAAPIAAEHEAIHASVI